MRIPHPLVSSVFLVLAAAGSGIATSGAVAAQSSRFQPEHVAQLPWRHIGPANMIGRITDFEPVASRPGTYYVASASGGLFKTENAGTTWTALFQHETSVSIGDVAYAPSNPDIVWVGTGEENARNSVSWGDGVYKSTDGGKTFQKVGLEQSFQIGHIEIHPTNPDIVYVAALGRLWGDNEERGVYRTRDGGKSWEKVLYADEKTGCIDIKLEPSNPEMVYAVMYERRRDMFDGNDPIVRFGPKSGIYRSTDAGDSWERMKKGLPTCNWGRCSIETWAKKPGTVFALLETERSGWARGDSQTGRESKRAYMGVGMVDNEKGVLLDDIERGSPADKAGLELNDIVVAMDGKTVKNSEELGDAIDEREKGQKVKLAVLRGDDEKELELTFGPRPAGGRSPNAGRLGGQNGNVQDRQGDLGYETGGVFRSDDFGVTWTRLNSLIPRPFYFCSFTVDPQDDENIYVCGIQLWKSTDGGKRFRQCNRGIHVDFHDVWVDPTDSDHVIASSDGGVNFTFDQGRTWDVHDNFCAAQFYKVAVDQDLPYNVYGGLQDNGTWGGPSRSRYSNGATNEDWIKIYSGDGFGAAVDPEDPNIVYATSQLGNVGRVDLRTGGQSRIARSNTVDGVRCQFNWDTPFFISPHNPRIFYFAGNFAFRSLNRGDSSEPISGQLGATDKGTATAFAESPRQAGLLYVGTDDGAAWVSRDNGIKWTRFDKDLPDMPGPRYISSFAPSHHSTGRVYLTMDGHRSDDLNTYVFMSSDYGKTWKSIKANLPDNQPVHILCEDPGNSRLLFLGTEFSCFVSFDRGNSWLELDKNLPTVAVRDLAIQNRDAELVAATHGRGMWVLDIAPLREFSRSVARKKAHLFPPQPSYLWRTIPRYQTGHKVWAAPRAPAGSSIYLFLGDKPEKAPEIVIQDLTGKELAKLEGKAVAGIQRIQWDGRSRSRSPRVRPGSTSPRRRPARGPTGDRPPGNRAAGGRFGGRGGAPVAPGTYRAVFTVDGETQIQPIELRADPAVTAGGNGSHPLQRN